MKANELMIGDWVMDINDNKPISISELGSNVVVIKEDNLYRYYDELSPIHITEEILEKNGWKNKWWWDLPECPFSLVKYCENSWADGKWGVMFNSEDNSPSFLIGGIHELQHLLRLCELNELADNFKVA